MELHPSVTHEEAGRRSIVRWFEILLCAVPLAVMACASDSSPVEPPPTPHDTPADTATGNGWRSVTTGIDHTCALDRDGTVYCWGGNANGQLGSVTSTVCGAPPFSFSCSVTPQLVRTAERFTQVAAGAYHTCGLGLSGVIYCWGANDRGQLGTAGDGLEGPARVPGGPWRQVAAGFNHSCGVRFDGSVWCWGSNDHGELGDGTTLSDGSPIRSAISAVATVAAGLERTCAVTTTGSMYCWGDVWMYRQGALEMSRHQTTPAVLPGVAVFASVTVGAFTTCAVDAGGKAYCWEGNPRGQMGSGTLIGSTTPVPVVSGDVFVQLSAGLVQSCGVSTSGTAYCWGDDTFGQLGVDPTAVRDLCDTQQLPCNMLPVAVSGGRQYASISTGLGSHTCAVTTAGSLLCWGLGVSGQRGDGTTTMIGRPAEVPLPAFPSAAARSRQPAR